MTDMPEPAELAKVNVQLPHILVSTNAPLHPGFIVKFHILHGFKCPSFRRVLFLILAGMLKINLHQPTLHDVVPPLQGYTRRDKSR